MNARYAVTAVLLLAACTEGSQAPLGPTGSPAGAVRAPAANGPTLRTPGERDRYIVVFKPEIADAPALATSMATAMSVQPLFVYQRVLPGFAATLSAAEVAQLRNDPQVAYVEVDQLLHISTTQAPTPSWGLDRIDQSSLPLDNSYTYPTSGAGVHFYGIDTGIRTSHVDFAGRTQPGFTAISDGNGTDDCNGHGTHTASTASGATYGVAKGMTVTPVRVLDCSGSGFTSQVIAGVDWVTSNAVLPAVANMSLGGGPDAALDAAVAASVASGIVYSVAAGNENTNACNGSPAREPSAITVGATDITDRRADFSNFGTCLDIFGPGVAITAAWNSSNTASAVLSGTSMSAPHVAGVAGLYLEGHPGDTPSQVAQAIVDNALIGAVGKAGSGSPNKLLNMSFIGGGTPGNQAPVADFVVTCDANLVCTFDGTSSTDDQGITAYAWSRNGNTFSTASTFTRSFGASRSITLTLTVTDAQGLSDSLTKTVDIAPGGGGGGPPGNAPPVADFTWSCTAGRVCTFDGTPSTDDQGITAYSWTRPGGKVASTAATFTRSFGAARTFDLSLTVTDGGGLTDSKTETIVVP